jgi:hypothetical protein
MEKKKSTWWLGALFIERGRISARGRDLLEGLLEEKCREDEGDILQVDRLAFLDICRGRTSDLSEGRTGDAEGRTHCAEAVFFWVVFVLLRSI